MNWPCFIVITRRVVRRRLKQSTCLVSFYLPGKPHSCIEFVLSTSCLKSQRVVSSMVHWTNPSWVREALVARCVMPFHNPSSPRVGAMSRPPSTLFQHCRHEGNACLSNHTNQLSSDIMRCQSAWLGCHYSYCLRSAVSVKHDHRTSWSV